VLNSSQFVWFSQKFVTIWNIGESVSHVNSFGELIGHFIARLNDEFSIDD